MNLLHKKYSGIIFLIISLGIFGCSKNTITDPGNTQNEDVNAVEKQVSNVDTIASFMQSDGQTIDDITISDMESGQSTKTATPIVPIKWGRHIFWNLIDRQVSSQSEGDTAIVVTVTRTIPAELRIGVRFAGSISGIDSVIKKRFTEVVQRKVRFVRIARKNQSDSNWVARSISLVLGRTSPDSLNTCSINSLELISNVDTTITDPLSTWFRYGKGVHAGIPQFYVGDSVKLRVTLTSRNDSNEVVMLRHGVRNSFDPRHRLIMSLSSTTGGPGNFVRVYERTFIVTMQPSIGPKLMQVEFNAMVDVWSYNSLYDDSFPVNNEFWGIPYFIR